MNVNFWLKNIVENDDQFSFKNFFDHFYPRVLNFTSYLMGCRQVSEDVSLEVFVRFWNNRKNISHFENIQNYLFVTAKHLVINYLSQNKHIKYMSFEGVDLKNYTCYTNPEDDLINEELKIHLSNAIDQLPEKCKMIYMLAKEENLKYREVAELLDISIKTVEAQMGIALSRLRKALKEYGNDNSYSNSRKISNSKS
jgi:RNA polymerase sigma-70 factor (family 1)